MYEEYISEVEQLKKIVERIQSIESEITSTYDINRIAALEYEQQQLKLNLQGMEISSLIRKYGVTEELIKRASELGVRRTLSEKELKQNEYDLSSETIISKITGKPINIKYLSVEEKIEVIYKHTGEVITSQDPIIINKCQNSCERFISELSERYSTRKLKAQYGENWKDKVMELYTSGYNSAFDYQTNQIIEKVENNNKQEQRQQEVKSTSNSTTEVKAQNSSLRKENEELRQTITIYRRDIERLNEENQNLREEITRLKQQIADMQQEHKRDMEFLKESIVQINHQVSSTKEQTQKGQSQQQMFQDNHMSVGGVPVTLNENGELVTNAGIILAGNTNDYASSENTYSGRSK